MSRIPYLRAGIFGDFDGIAVINQKGEPLAGIIYHGFVPETKHIQVTAASVGGDVRWMTRPLLDLLLSFPFEVLGAERMSAVVATTNETAKRVLQGFGFKRETNDLGMRRVIPGGGDAHIFGLLKGEQKIFTKRNA